MTSVTISNSVTSIGSSAFEYCTGLTSVYCEATNPPTLILLDAVGHFSHTGNCPIYVPCGSVSAYQSAAYWSNYALRIRGTPGLEFSYNFTSSNDTMGTVTVGVVDTSYIIFGEADCDSNITIIATANNGYRFIGWSDGGPIIPYDTGSYHRVFSRTIHITSDTTVTALFDFITYAVVGYPRDWVQGAVTGSDTVYYGDTVDGVLGIVTGSDTVYYGDTVTLTAVPNYGYHFTRWSDWTYDNPRTVVATTDVTYTAYFEPNSYTVTVVPDNTAQGTVGGSGSTAYQGRRYIYATPATGYHFSHWSDGDSNASRYITVEGDTTLTAFFEINSYTLTVLPNDTMLGTVTGSGTYTYGTQVTITATPAVGNRFDRWSDNSLLANYTFTLLNDLQLVAVFVPVDTVHVHDTTIVRDTTYIDVPYAVHDTTVVRDTTYIDVPYAVHDTTIVRDTTYIDVPYAVHDTTIVRDTTYIDVPYAVHDTTTMRDTLYLPVYLHDTAYVAVHDTTYLDVLDTLRITDTVTVTEYVSVHDTTYIDVHDTTIVTLYDTTYIDVPYAVHDTTVVRDTTYIDVPYAVHDTTIVRDTTYIDVPYAVHDTTIVRDTTYIDVPYAVHDTTVVRDTTYIDVPYAVHDTTIVRDTTYIDVPYAVHDTTVVVDTMTVTEYVPVHDTTYITMTDTVTNTVYDTITNTIFDTIDNIVYDTTIVHDTTLVTDTLYLTLYDTVYITIHDTIYVYDTIYVGVDEANMVNAKVYINNGQIVVDGTEGNHVWLYDINGRLLATKQDNYQSLRFDVQASGTYLVKIGNHPARRVVVIR